MDPKAELELLRNLDLKSATVGLAQVKAMYSQAMASASKMAGLATDLPIGKIDSADFLKEIPAMGSIGKLGADQVTGLMSQASTLAGSAGGIGKFGLDPKTLESTGLLKPGTVQQFLGGNKSPDEIKSILSSPTVWSGKDGAGDLTSFLQAPNLQAGALQDSMKSAMTKLESMGTGISQLSSKDIGAAVQNAVKFGPEAAGKWLDGSAPPDLSSAMDGLAKGAQNAVSFVTKEAANLKLELPVEPATGVVNRAAVDNALSGIIGDDKIPSPKFGQGLLDGLPNSQLVPKDMSDLKELAKVNEERLKRGLSALGDIKNQVAGAVSNITGQLNSVASQMEQQLSGAAKTVTSTVQSSLPTSVTTLSEQAGGGIQSATISSSSVLARLNNAGLR